MAADLSRVPALVRERIKELEEELKEGGFCEWWCAQHVCSPSPVVVYA